MAKFKLGICGGTFDLFHIGHKIFISEALKKSEKIVLGITSDSYIKTFKADEDIESFASRKKTVENFLEHHGFRNKVKVISINNPYEPLLTITFDPEAIFVTPQTKDMGKEINRKRKRVHLKTLKIIVLPLKQAEGGGIISSTRIRSGEINREGRSYINPKWKNKKLILPLNMREVLSKPLGKVLSEVPEDIEKSKTITVGDITTQKFNNQRICQFLSVVDFLVKREKKFNTLVDLGFDSDQDTLFVKNPPGVITTELFQATKKVFESGKRRKVILIEGEEDLSVLPVLLVAPLGFSIFYGQPNQGLVKVNVSEKSKERASKLLDSFIIE